MSIGLVLTDNYSTLDNENRIGLTDNYSTLDNEYRIGFN